jgi:UPF0755 protein
MRRLGRAALVAVLVIGAAGAWLWYAIAGDRTLPVAPTEVVIQRGDTLADAAAWLKRAGALQQPLALRLAARLRGADAAIESGEYRIPAHQSADEILGRLIRGEVDAVWVTIPEGYTAREIAERLGERHLADPHAFARWCTQNGIELAGKRTPTLEGYLFPSTYLLPLAASPAALARIFTDQFRAELPPDADRLARAQGLDVSQVIALASLIEREAKVDSERPLMAGVYYNRLRAGMPLQVDATIEYVFPEHHTVITRRDLELASPYNTYRHTGLPPTPIANPGKPSIDAAFHPTPSRYLYYVYRGNGHHAFAATLTEHEANVKRYLK